MPENSDCYTYYHVVVSYCILFFMGILLQLIFNLVFWPFHYITILTANASNKNINFAN